jgi:predicted DNA-binding protein
MQIQLSKELDEKLEKFSRLTGQTKASLVRIAIEIYLPIQERRVRKKRRRRFSK